MEPRRQNQREQRRRRVLRDDLGAGEETPVTETRQRSAAAIRRAYTESALREGQPRITDFIPRRWWAIPVIACVGMLAITALVALHYYRPSWEARVPSLNLMALDLTSAGSLARWFSSLVLLLAAVMSWIVYHMRRHKTDDYRGGYGLWIWASVALVLASLDAATHLHRAPQGWLRQQTGATWLGDASSVGLFTIGIPAMLGGLRMLVDMRRSRLACATLASAALSYGGAMLIALEMIRINSPAWNAMTGGGLMMLGHLSLLLGIAVFARHILLVALGVVDVPVGSSRKKTASRWAFWRRGNSEGSAKRKGRAKRVAAKISRSQLTDPADDADDEEDDEEDSARPLSRSVRASGSASRGAAASATERDSDDDGELDDEDDDSFGDRQVSRSERRRLRKQSRQQRKAG